MNHTPGPWTISDDGTIEARGLGLVGHVKNMRDSDRALIAAAPAMLELARQIVLAAADNEGDIPGDIISGALSVIAATEGQA